MTSTKQRILEAIEVGDEELAAKLTEQALEEGIESQEAIQEVGK